MDHTYNCIGHELKIPNVVESQGVYLFDENGKRYMDLESGVWCISLGHKNRRVNEVIARQIDAVMHAGFCYSNEVLDASAAAVLDVVNFEGGKCVFLCSGSEAIEISRQIARHLTGKSVSMTLHDSYLGAYSSVSDRRSGWYCFDWERCRTCEKNNDCDPVCEKLQEIPECVSDFVFEPGSSSGFVRFPPKALIQNIVHAVRENGGKIIANEVTTGVGRTGKWFGYQYYDVEPDMIAMGKGIGNGYPVSVAAINRKTMDELEAKRFKYSQSHQNDPLGAAVVGEVVRIIEGENLIAESMRKGAIFLSQLESLVDHDIVLAVRGRGLMFAMDFVDEDIADGIHDELIKKGYIVGNRGTSFRIDPPLIMTESEFTQFIDAFKSIIAERENVP
jgi:acetylornithine/N-succinyldiaminopimelate aminotransferase